MSLLDPITSALAAILAAAHDAATALGAPPTSATTWLVAIATLVVTVRLAVLPLVIHGVRHGRAVAAARPDLLRLTERFRGRTDADSVRELWAERRRIRSEHGLSRLGGLALLAQLPIWYALYHLLSDVAGGQGVGAMTAPLVASLCGATLVGVGLAQRGYLGAGPAHLAVVAALALVAAGSAYAAQRWFVLPNTLTDGLPPALLQAQRLLPTVSATGLLVAAGVVPVALLGYWAISSLWTLGQSAVVWRYFPTPGTPAATRRRRD